MKTSNKKSLRLNMLQRLTTVMSIQILFFMVFVGSGCKDSTTDSNNSGQISMTSRYSTLDSSSGIFPIMISTKGAQRGAIIDSIRITRARFVLRDIKYKTQSDSSNFRATPFVLELNLATTVQDISVKGVVYGTYRRIEFDVHRINTNDVTPLPLSEQFQFQDFLAGERYSIIINGTSYTAGIGTTFTFKSKVNVKQKIDLDPVLVVNQPTPAINATMLICSGRWFKSSTGILIDPSDSANENTISDNLRASIKVYKDNNKDGSKDLE